MEIRPRLNGNKKTAYENLTKKERRILVIGDLHAPFTLDGYLSFCKDIYAQYNCNQVIFIGDIIDAHGWSFHEQDPDGMSAGNELSVAVKKIAHWYKAFPKADVCIGNHDRLASRKAYTMWFVGKKFRVFGMQVGCGVDSTTYAAAYAKNFKKQAIGCGVVIGGHTAINKLMEL